MTAFNGTKPAGLDTILLHSRTSAGTTTVLTGTLKQSDVGGFGKMLDVRFRRCRLDSRSAISRRPSAR